MMFKLVLDAILIIVSILVVRGLVFSLRSGVISFGKEQLNISADRAKDPVGFWSIFVSNALAVLFFLWLMIFR